MDRRGGYFWMNGCTQLVERVDDHDVMMMTIMVSQSVFFFSFFFSSMFLERGKGSRGDGLQVCSFQFAVTL